MTRCSSPISPLGLGPANVRAIVPIVPSGFRYSRRSSFSPSIFRQSACYHGGPAQVPLTSGKTKVALPDLPDAVSVLRDGADTAALSHDDGPEHVAGFQQSRDFCGNPAHQTGRHGHQRRLPHGSALD